MKYKYTCVLYLAIEILLIYVTYWCFKTAYDTFFVKPVILEIRLIIDVIYGWIPLVMGILIFPMDVYILYKIAQEIKKV